jgi:hypothetical protein
LPNPLEDTKNVEGMTLVAFLFDGSLNWKFVYENSDSPAQFFVYMPQIIQTALGISRSQIRTVELHVYIPNEYRTVADVDMLRTMYWCYIPSDTVSTLASQLKAKSSVFYTGVNNDVAQQLAARVDASYGVTQVTGSTNSGNDSGPGDDGINTSSSSGKGDKSRQDAIIGVVSALGGVTIILLVLLVFRSLKRRAALAHRRLSDPPQGNTYMGERPDGQDFDRDSIGGQRRRSFYFAADSITGAAQQRAYEEEYSRQPQAMRQRGGGAISTPVLRDNTMNW